LNLTDIAAKSPLSLSDLVKLEEAILKTGYMSHERALEEIERFVVKLGIDEYYFKTTSIEEISRHLIAISASELVSKYGGEGIGLQLMNERADRAVYIVEDESTTTDEIEKRIEKRYPSFRLESYRTMIKTMKAYLRLYVVTKPVYRKGVRNRKSGLPFEDVTNKAFMERSAPETIERYRDAWESMNNRESPFIKTTEKPETGETRVMVGIPTEGPRQFLNYFSNLLDKHGIYSNRKYREPFYDGKTVYSFYFNKVDGEAVSDFERDLNVAIMLPRTSITKLFLDRVYSAQETMYALSAAAFTHQFLTVLTDEYRTIAKALKDQPEARGTLDLINMRLIKDTFSEARIAQAVHEHHEIVSRIFSHFVGRLHPEKPKKDLAGLEAEILGLIEQNVPSNKDKAILRYFLTFNKTVLKTNFFMRDKTCMAYRLDSSFLNEIDFPEKPFGVIFFFGREFIGFHVRFRDIARGGIRIIKSRNLTYYEHNLDTLFLENYNLASTQQKKNKDIPEGGSKGTILLNLRNQDEGERAFRSYIDGMMDVIMPTEEVLDLYRENELLFLGPDERTADLMEWAALYAKRRGYPFWKAFTTGKAPAIGGIPHDMFGMTTAGVHEYVTGVFERLGMREEDVAKVQTGGPDGDLGSNEILISRDRTISVVDGSGVLYDPDGIDREELGRLAKKRKMVEHFSTDKLSPKGFFVSINDKEIALPDGSVVPNGEEFRNRFHLHPLAKGDLFVPCGGRPAAININNWKSMFDEGVPKFRIIVEGANLFITEEARLRLEENGVIVLKDASTNKGGVTSSSLEVFASLALKDGEFEEHMMVKEGGVPAFRKAYVKEIVKVIRRNARMEFDLMWKEHEKSGVPFTLLTNRVSGRINDITDSVYRSDLPNNPKIREMILCMYVPKPLMDLVGIRGIVENVPENYLNAIISTKIATSFVYTRGIEADEIDFYNYVRALG